MSQPKTKKAGRPATGKTRKNWQRCEDLHAAIHHVFGGNWSVTVRENLCCLNRPFEVRVLAQRHSSHATLAEAKVCTLQLLIKNAQEAK